jgi:DnaJ-class molecular chaperone
MEDPYKILGVNENSTQEEIKKAYRKLSLKYHPDKNKGNKENTEMFKKINNAYQLLGNDENRRKYHQQKENPFAHNNSGFNMNGANMDIFKMFFNNQNPFFNVQQHMAQGGNPNIKIFHNGKPIHFQNVLQKPPPIVKTLEITLTQAYNGLKQPVHIEKWIQEGNVRRTEKETLYFDIPRGIDNNEIIVLKERGNVNQHNLKGDIKIFIKIKNDTLFTRNGMNIIFKKNISFKESLCGFTFDLPYFNNRSFKINNDPGNIITPNFKKMVPDMGMQRENKKGDLIIEFIIDYPKNITADQAKQISRILG